MMFTMETHVLVFCVMMLKTLSFNVAFTSVVALWQKQSTQYLRK